MRETTLLLLLAPAAGLLTDVLLQAALPRLATRSGHIRLQFFSFGAGAVTTVILLAAMMYRWPFTAPDRAGYFVLHFLIYACFGFCFFNVISANVSSLRVRILKEMLARHPAPMGNAALRAQYSAREMLAARLARLERGGQIDARAGRYYLRKKSIALIGGFFAALRRLLLKA
jgi:hypothetical protein